MPQPFQNHRAFRLTGLCYCRLTQSSQSEVLSTLVCAVSPLLSDLTQPLLSDAFFQPGNLSIFSPALPLSPLQFYIFQLNDTGTTSSSPTERELWNAETLSDFAQSFVRCLPQYLSKRGCLRFFVAWVKEFQVISPNENICKQLPWKDI